MTDQAKKLIKERYTFKDLEAIVAYLRSKDGCPWDRVQTHRSIRKNLIEECYEAAEGIDREDPVLLCEELGDLLLQVVFHARISEEQGEFTLDDAVDGVCKKMIRRHPHVFLDAKAQDPERALERWEEAKKREKRDDTLFGELDRVARTLPSLMRTQKLQKKAAKRGADKQGTPAPVEELKRRYIALCSDANASGVDLEELAYAFNEEYIKAFKTDPRGGEPS